MVIASERFYRIAGFILFLLVLTNALAVGLRTAADSDMGWHLATGQYVAQHRHIPSTDVLSYTSAGKTWIYPPFAGVLLYLVYTGLGYAGISWFCALACFATVAYLVRRRDVFSAALALCAVAPIAFRMEPRADLFNTFFFAIFLGELWAFYRGSRARLWLLPGLMVLWVNMHPGFILGVAVLGAYLVMEGCEVLFSERRQAGVERLRRVWPWLVGTAVATLANPWGPRLYAASFTLAGLRRAAPGTFDTSAYIDEFLPVRLSPHFFVQLVDLRNTENGSSWLIVVALVVIAIALRQKRLGVALVQAVILYASLQHVRYIGLFCIATVIFGGTLLGGLFTVTPSAASQRNLSESRPLATVPYSLASILVCVLCCVTVLHIVDFVSNRTYVVFGGDSRFGAGEAFWFPERAANFIRREHLPGNVFEEFTVGGFAAWRLGPGYPNFIDGRADHLNPALLIEHFKLLTQNPDSQIWLDAANRWGINVLLISEASSRAVDRQDALGFCQSSTWRPVYMDEVSLVLLRNTAENQAAIQRLQIDCLTRQLTPPASLSGKELYDFYANAGGLLYALRRDHESEDALLRAAALYPEDPNIRLVLGQLYQRQQRLDEAEREYYASLTRNETDSAWYLLGRLYSSEQRWREAEHAFQSAAELSFRPFTTYLALGQVELSLREDESALGEFELAEKTSPYRNGTESLAPELYAQIAAGQADAHWSLGHSARAIEFQQEAVRLNPSVAGWNKLADMFESAGEVERSAQAREKARDLRAINSGR